MAQAMGKTRDTCEAPGTGRKSSQPACLDRGSSSFATFRGWAAGHALPIAHAMGYVLTPRWGFCVPRLRKPPSSCYTGVRALMTKIDVEGITERPATRSPAPLEHS